MKKDVGNMIKIFRKYQGWTQAQLGEKLGVSDKAVSSWEKGRTEPGFDNLFKMSELFHISISTLMQSPKDLLRSTTDSQWIPVLGRVAAGIPLNMIQDIIDWEEIPNSMGDCFALRIQGDSMSPDIVNGSTVIVRKQSDVESGEIAIVSVNGDDATCKRVIKHSLGVTLAPINPCYEPMVFSNEEIEYMPIRVLGKVVEVRRKF